MVINKTNNLRDAIVTIVYQTCEACGLDTAKNGGAELTVTNFGADKYEVSATDDAYVHLEGFRDIQIILTVTLR